MTDFPVERPSPENGAGAGDAARPGKPGVYFNVHLVSDSTGETLAGVVRASCAQFDNILPIEHTYFLVRSGRQMDRVLAEIEEAPGVVMFTLSNVAQRERLEEFCKTRGIPHVAVLDSALDMMSRYLGLDLNHRVGAGRILSAEYFRRIDALNFAASHDDGQQVVELRDADVILVGVSRTSKTPTSVYLANRGVKAANVPIVPHIPLPQALFELEDTLIVGLTISADRLVGVRRNRLKAMNEARETSYVDEEAVRSEIVHATRTFERHGWPVIDVSRRSVEETAAAILNLIAERRSGE
ncbi:MAG: pyruvate, phosphate dikinase/phosphoenolpyruvate synthase regulator [Alphaproteobacteria bacterium]|nr:pyruvate, phosphate dikinase/phosphoenolpyruvate synthase regulator [Alphaproteobacteria bacterium]